MNNKIILSGLCFLIFAKAGYAQVSPLLSTTWNQGCHYNADCPTTGTGGACGRVYTGCNATAIAQIFKYYGYPASGIGSHCNTNAPGHCVDFSTQTYNYTSMPNNVSSPNAEVAKLMYHLGIAVDMMWSGSSSNSFFSAVPLKKHFKYSPRMYGTSTFMFNTTQELIDAIKTELNAGRPVYAKGGSHFYLIDGYNLSNQFHMNFGWGGIHDGYYSITSVVNGAGNFTPTNFLFNIKPMAGDLETAVDTIVVSANASTNQAIDFTSLHNWTMSTNAAWINLNLTTGTQGFYYIINGSSFNTPLNNGPVRYGHIYIDNGNDIDTIVVKQEASPLVISPVNLTYSETGGTQNISVSYHSWATWTATTTDLWISLSPASGTGNGSVAVTCSANTSSSPRTGKVTITGGSFQDTVFIYQDPSVSTSLSQLENPENLILSPNPANESLFLSHPDLQNSAIEIYSINGKIVWSGNSNADKIQIHTNHFENGIYIMFIRTQNKFIQTKFTVLR